MERNPINHLMRTVEKIENSQESDRGSVIKLIAQRKDLAISGIEEFNGDIDAINAYGFEGIADVYAKALTDERNGNTASVNFLGRSIAKDFGRFGETDIANKIVYALGINRGGDN
ncbi:MAG: hypothetical protein Q7T54_06360 [Candidatus Levybacteria bacterium]|nr:hypothetical protein [Candidatus Levybacteria bacterium]